MNEEQINAVIDNLAGKLGTTVEAATPIAKTMVAETAALGVGYLCWCALMLLMGLAAICSGALLLRAGIRMLCEENTDGQENAGIGMCSIGAVALMAAIPMLISASCSYGVGMRCWLAPTSQVVRALL
jgi:hypothetical protein